MTAFMLCVSDTNGWKRLHVEIDVPAMISDIETRMRTNEKLSEEQSGQLKKFWRATDAAMRLAHGVGEHATTILKSASTTEHRAMHEAPIGSIRTNPQSRIDVELTNPQLRKDDPRALVLQTHHRETWSLHLYPVILLRELVTAWKKTSTCFRFRPS